MATRLAGFGLIAITTAALAAAAAAQQPAPTSPTGQNPVERSVTEQQILQQSGRAHGAVTIPDFKEAMLEQPQGRDYQDYHERLLPLIGGVLIIGMLVLLTAFYLWSGPVRLSRSLTGIKILRFTVIERFIHWMTAASFIVLAITGLNYVFGKRLLFPLIGAEAFSTWSQWAKLLHNAFPWPFILGLLVMIGLWIRDNLPDRYDLAWLRQLGGFVSGRHPPARRFNAGQKLIFWSVAIGGVIMVLSGIILLFPFWLLGINGMQLSQYVHATAGMVMIAIIIAHIYIGTVGMQGAIDAMGTGEVDLAWAEEHHPVWVEEERARRPAGPQVGAPAE